MLQTHLVTSQEREISLGNEEKKKLTFITLLDRKMEF